MAAPNRTVLYAALIGLCFLIGLVYVYVNDRRGDVQIFKKQITLANGTKVFVIDEKAPLTGNGAGQAKLNNAEEKTANLGFVHAFIASISVIVVSELGDKTFFIAAIMAMRHPRMVIYIGAMGALGAMTILSALLGNIVTKFVPRIYTFYLSSILFACFGIKMLKDGYAMSPDEGVEEYKEVQQELDEAEAADDLESGGGGGTEGKSSEGNQHQTSATSNSRQKGLVTKIVAIARRYVSPIFIQALILTFLAVSNELEARGESTCCRLGVGRSISIDDHSPGCQ